MNDSIIVYRNPLEKAIWEGDYSNAIVPVMFGLAAGMATLFAGLYIVTFLNI